MTDKSKHINHMREALMMTLAVYINSHDNVTDAEVLGALGACMCEGLVIKGVPFSDAFVDTLRKTYEVVETQHAMYEKQQETVQ